MKMRESSVEPKTEESRILFLAEHEDTEYFSNLGNLFQGANVRPVVKEVHSAWEVTRAAKKHGYSGIVTTRTDFLKALLGWHNSRKEPSLDLYQGSMFSRDGMEIVFIKPLRFMSLESHQTFLNKRFISKLTKKTDWAESPEFSWIHGNKEAGRLENLLLEFESADLIAIDIETRKWNRMIDSVSWSAVWISPGGDKIQRVETLVLEIDSMWAVAWMRKFNLLSPAKIGHNFLYDLAYFFRYNSLPTNWLWDTINCFHAWYSELPKDLSTVASFLIREYTYWKDLAESSSREDQLRYNALDTYATAISFCTWIVESPDWAKRNYLQKFPINFPSFMCNMRGLKRNQERHQESRDEVESEETKTLQELRISLNEPDFNPGSHIQVKKVLTILGCSDIAETSSDEKSLKKASYRHPLNERIFNKVLDIRGLRKLKTTYLRTEEDMKSNGEGGAKEWNGRIFYNLVPYGTETGRNACQESSFWCGFQIQNIPQGPAIKKTIEADPGFNFCEVDLEQAESRDTAYIVGEENLIAAVEGERDFHSVNCSAFFGIPYGDIYDDARQKVISKSIRNLGKRVNHGANYNMGARTMVETMGLAMIFEAGRILKLNITNPIKIAEFLLERFHLTYPKIRSVYYACVKRDVRNTRLLVSTTEHLDWNRSLDSIELGDYSVSNLQGWTRYCFGNPDCNKLDLNSYVAHCPQSLNAMTLDKAFMRVFYDIAIHPKFRRYFRLNAQIHDSILFQYAEDHVYLCDMVRDRMEIPIVIKSYDGKLRKFKVPAAIKNGKNGKPAKFWSETE